MLQLQGAITHMSNATRPVGPYARRDGVSGALSEWAVYVTFWAVIVLVTPTLVFVIPLWDADPVCATDRPMFRLIATPTTPGGVDCCVRRCTKLLVERFRATVASLFKPRRSEGKNIWRSNTRRGWETDAQTRRWDIDVSKQRRVVRTGNRIDRGSNSPLSITVGQRSAESRWNPEKHQLPSTSLLVYCRSVAHAVSPSV